MIIDFPANCNNEASRWSFCIKLNEVLRLWHNESCIDMSAKQTEIWRRVNFYPHFNAVMASRNAQINIAKSENHWNPEIPDHVSNGIINYPAELNQDNEGSRASFLFGIEHKLIITGKDISDIDMKAIQESLQEAKQEAINNSYWNPSIENIINV